MRNKLLSGLALAALINLPAYAQTVAEPAAPAAQVAAPAQPAIPPATPEPAPAPAAPAAAAALAGQGVIVMDKALQEQLITKAKPDSFTGGATSLSFPIGVKIREAAVKGLGPAFADGVAVAETNPTGAYGVVLRLDGFTYKYDSLSGFGFTITPRVTVTITAEALGPDGVSLFRKAYSRQDFTAGAYVASFKPKEKVIGSLEKALEEIFAEVAADLAKPTPAAAVAAVAAPTPTN